MRGVVGRRAIEQIIKYLEYLIISIVERQEQYVPSKADSNL